MAKAVLPVQAGFDYQAELFWQKACDLFLPHTKTERVEYEVDDQKSFDDVVVTYSAPIPDLYDTYKVKEFFQAKFHSKNTAPILYGSLIDPAYIGATTYSFLQKLLNADRNAADDRYVYTLFSPSSVHPDDALAGVWSNFDGSIDIDGLFVGKTPASKMGEIRQAWSSHLEIEEGDLKTLLRKMRIFQGPDLKRFREDLNKSFLLAGLKPVDATKRANPYEDLIRKIHAGKNSLTFDRNRIETIAKEEDLWVGNPSGFPAGRTIGIRSFFRFAEEMPNLTDDMICLCPHFDGRHIRLEADWNDRILPTVNAFLQKHEGSAEQIYVLLETHISIAFAAGMVINPKAPATFVPIQRNQFRDPEAWNTTGNYSEAADWKEDEITGDNSDALAVTVSVTHSVTADVKEFVGGHLGTARIVSFEIMPGPSTTAIKSGDHAFALAEGLAQSITKAVKGTGIRKVHIFAAAPVGFMFYLGRLLKLPSSCEINIYEYNFDTRDLGAYTNTITFNRTT